MLQQQVHRFWNLEPFQDVKACSECAITVFYHTLVSSTGYAIKSVKSKNIPFFIAIFFFFFLHSGFMVEHKQHARSFTVISSGTVKQNAPHTSINTRVELTVTLGSVCKL